MNPQKQQLIDELKRMSTAQREINPRPEWIAENRLLLLGKIKRSVEAEEKPVLGHIWEGMSIFLPPRLVYSVMRPVMVVVLIFSVAGGLWITSVNAAHGSVPGDRLYYIKRATENAQLAVAHLSGNPGTVGVLRAERAVRRIEEARKLARSSDSKITKGRQVQRAVGEANKEMKNLNKELERAKAESPAKAVSIVKAVSPEVEAVEEMVKKANGDIAGTISLVISSGERATAEELVKEMNEIGTLVGAAQRTVSEVIVAKHQEDKTTVSENEVKNHLGAEINRLTQEIEGTSVLTNKKADALQEELGKKDDKGKAAQNIVTQTKKAQEEVNSVSAAAKESLGEAEQLIKEKEYVAAAEKVATAREFASTAAQKATGVAEVAKNVADVAASGQGTNVQRGENVNALLPVFEQLAATSSVLIEGRVSVPPLISGTGGIVQPTANPQQ